MQLQKQSVSPLVFSKDRSYSNTNIKKITVIQLTVLTMQIAHRYGTLKNPP